MPKLVYRTAALRDLAEIAAYIEDESGSRETADRFIEKVTSYLAGIAKHSSLVGRPRPELSKDYRSLVYGNYVVLFRYGDEEGPRSHLYIGNVIHGRRDLAAYFASQSDADES